jgi:hypothetical protein
MKEGVLEMMMTQADKRVGHPAGGTGEARDDLEEAGIERQRRRLEKTG